MSMDIIPFPKAKKPRPIPYGEAHAATGSMIGSAFHAASGITSVFHIGGDHS